jgi:hypothetical protein
MMESIIIKRLMRLIYPLNTELKLELLTRLSNSLKLDFRRPKKDEKEILLRELYGSWADMDEQLAMEIE